MRAAIIDTTTNIIRAYCFLLYIAQIVLAEDVYLIAAISAAVLVFMFRHRMRVFLIV